MKKTYVKPALAVESFVLSQSIAANCGVSGGETEWGRPCHGDKTICGWEDILGRVLWLSEPACKEIVGPDYGYGGICYNNPNGGATIFAS